MALRVLIVDDDDIDRQSIARILKKANAATDITAVSTVDEAIDCLQSSSFDVVLLDYRMPGRDGIELLHYLNDRRIHGGVAIIVLSTSSEEALALSCLEAGAEDFICKSELSQERINRAIIHATTRFKLEKQLWESFNRVKELAERDTLTGLANRYLFEQTLRLAITNNRHKERLVALILFDLDHFKWVNDSYGHDVGDQLLKRVVQRVTSCLRGNEMFARLGGDEFAIMVMNLDRAQQAHSISERIIRVLHKPFTIEEIEVSASPSIGVALHPDNGESAEELFKKADIAMYRSKRNGRNQISFFSNEMQNEVLRRVTLEQDLRNALIRNEFELYFQPVIQPVNGHICGAEALIRWHHPTKGMVLPDQFMDVAEETGVIVELGHWVLDNGCRQLHRWRTGQRVANDFCLAINVSPRQLKDTQLLSLLESELLELGIEPSNIEFELTESALIDDTESVVPVLESIHQKGVRIALDDFGTGYSSVSHLRLFPIHTVKIDRSVIPDEQSPQRSYALLKGLVSMLQSMELDIVAEGIELDTQSELCRKLGINRAQGFAYSKPLPACEFEEAYLA